MTHHTRLLLCLLAFLSSTAIAQNPWTLQQCIDRAQQYNIQIKLSELNVQSSKIGVEQSAGNMVPTINGSASQNYFFGRSIDPFTNVFTTQEVRNNSFSLSSSVPVFQGFQLQNALKESRLTYLSSKADLQKIQNDISINVVTFYLQILYNQELLDVTTAQVAATDTQRFRTKRMFELGSASRANFLDLESQYASEELRLIQTRAQFDQSVLNLTQLLELETPRNFSVVKPEVMVPEFNAEQMNVERVYATALTNQPDIKSSEYKVLSAEKSLAGARSGRLPRVFASGALSTNYSTSSLQVVDFIQNPPTQVLSGFTSSGDTVYTLQPNIVPVLEKTPFRDQFSNNLGKSVGLTLQVPILNNWSVSSNIKRAKLNLEQNKLNLEQNRKNLYKSVQQAVADAVASYNKYRAGLRSVEALEETYNYNRERFNEGLISAFDFLTAKNNYQRAQADLIQSKYDYIFRIKILDFYQGKPLAF